MGEANPCILQVAVATPMRRVFDYLPPRDIGAEPLKPGIRLWVPFGRREHCVGFLLAVKPHTEVPVDKLRRAINLIDTEPLFSTQHLTFIRWASQYYQHPIGEVIFSSLPGLLRKGRAATVPEEMLWCVTETGKQYDLQLLQQAPRQAQILKTLQTSDTGVAVDELKEQGLNFQSSLTALKDKGLIHKIPRQKDPAPNRQTPVNHTLNKEQLAAVNAINASADRFTCFLLNGVTGSGKTEVYIQAITEVLKTGRQALILMPEIGLTPQFIQRFEQHFPGQIAVYHSGLTEQQRLATWIMAKDMQTRIVLGTRSALWLPFKQLGMIIIDEEHDLSYKQQEGFRYSARDLALVRARNEQFPIILGSATPSMESLYNVEKGNYQEMRLNQRVGSASLPDIEVLDVKGKHLHGPLSDRLIEAINKTLNQGQQVLVFLNRRGYAPALMCHECGWTAVCDRCDRMMTFHKQRQVLWCHHCDRQIQIDTNCPSCRQPALIEIGHGTEKIEEALASCFPHASIQRIDRDSTRRKGRMVQFLDDIQSGKTDILVGTQMLAKGHHFPAVTLVGVIDIDGGLYSTDFRASERMAQLLMQVSGRAGRVDKPGKVIVQTHHPDHPLLKTLVTDGYSAFASLLLEERKQTQLPPYSYLAMLRAEASRQELPERFLTEALQLLQKQDNKMDVYGPIPAPMQRRAGRYRMQLLIQAKNRGRLNSALEKWVKTLETMASGRRVRWSLDVDPQDMA